jgi:hypothetical protein
MKYHACRGITVWRWRWFKIELWYCPRNFVAEPHRHPDIDIELTFLYGSPDFYRNDLHIRPTPFTTFTLKHYHWHWFQTNNKCLIFFNREWWKVPPTSAATNYEKRHAL